MDKKTEALKQLSEFDRYFTSANGVDVPARIPVPRDEWRGLRDATRSALAEKPEQQQNTYIGWIVRNSQGKLDLLTNLQIDSSLEKYERLHKLYTSPPASKPWVGLTKEERDDFTLGCGSYETVCAIEAKLREKNA